MGRGGGKRAMEGKDNKWEVGGNQTFVDPLVTKGKNKSLGWSGINDQLAYFLGCLEAP